MSLLAELKDIDKLPTLPEILLEVLKLVNSAETDAAMLAEIIEQDPALTSRVLHMANSSFYGASGRRLSSVSLAVARLGFNEIRNITVAVSIVKHFAGRRSTLGYKAYWRHCLTAAFLCRAIAARTKKASDDDEGQRFFLAGLLHDIGILVLDQFFPEQFEKVSAHAFSNETSFLAAEHAVLDKETHPMLGGALLEMWRLEPSVTDAVRYHHAPSKGPQNHLLICAVTGLGEYVLCNGSLGSFEGSFEAADESIWATTGVEPDDVRQLSELAETEVRKSDLILTLGEESKGLRSI